MGPADWLRGNGLGPTGVILVLLGIIYIRTKNHVPKDPVNSCILEMVFTIPSKSHPNANLCIKRFRYLLLCSHRAVYIRKVAQSTRPGPSFLPRLSANLPFSEKFFFRFFPSAFQKLRIIREWVQQVTIVIIDNV